MTTVLDSPVIELVFLIYKKFLQAKVHPSRKMDEGDECIHKGIWVTNQMQKCSILINKYRNINLKDLLLIAFILTKFFIVILHIEGAGKQKLTIDWDI